MAQVSIVHGGAEIARVPVAQTFWTRLKGLLGNRRGLGPGEGLLIRPCDSIHTFFMAFPIDAVFLAEDGRILALHSSIPPWRLIPPVKGARQVVELPAGAMEAAGLAAGRRLEIV